MIAVVAVAAALSPAVLPANAPGRAALGVGVLSCGAWMGRPWTWQATNEWVQGYWSGLNGARDPAIGVTLTSTEVISRVRTQCLARPQQEVRTAVLQAFETAARRGD